MLPYCRRDTPAIQQHHSACVGVRPVRLVALLYNIALQLQLHVAAAAALLHAPGGSKLALHMGHAGALE